MSLPFFRNLMMSALMIGGVLVAAGLPGVASAQGAFEREGHKLLEAVRDQDITVAESILNNPENSTLINTRDATTGETAMHIVAARRDTTWIRFLAKHGANPNIADKDGVTPLMISTRLGHIEGVTALLEAGARVDPVSNTGETPLIFAVHKRDVPLVRILLANGANPDWTDNSGRSARDYVALIDERRLSEEFDAADDAREDAAAQDYGPSF